MPRLWTPILVLMLVGACAQDVLPPVTTTTTATTPTVTTAPTQTIQPDSVDVAWVPPGPIGTIAPTCPPPPSTSGSASPSPRPTQSCTGREVELATPEWKAAFTSRDCAAIGALGKGDTQPIYLGLSHACTALAGNNSASWKAARDALNRAGRTPTCPDRLALELLTTLVDAHERKPAARIRIVPPTVSPKAACQ